jgi:subtilisin family serine protease
VIAIRRFPMNPALLVSGVLLFGCRCGGQAPIRRATAPVTIAVIDDGVDVSHPELRGRIAGNDAEHPGDRVDDDHNGFIDDVNGYDFLEADPVAVPNVASGDPSHGTMMAIVALRAARIATHDDMESADLIKILPLRVADEKNVDAVAVANAIHYASSRSGHSVVNLSIGTIRRTLPGGLIAAIIREQNIVFVVAAGNRGKRIDEIGTSLCRIQENVVCVAAVDTNDRLSRSPKASNFGPLVELAAMGVDVTIPGSNGSNRTETGTSLAAAYVSGVAARVWSAAPQLNAADITRVLCSGARKSHVLGESVRCGIVDALRSLHMAMATSREIGMSASSVLPAGMQ